MHPKWEIIVKSEQTGDPTLFINKQCILCTQDISGCIYLAHPLFLRAANIRSFRQRWEELVQGKFAHPFVLPWSHRSPMVPHAVGAEHRTLDCEVGTTGWEAWHKDKYDRFRESLRLEKISKTIEFNLQPNTTISTESQH